MRDMLHITVPNPVPRTELAARLESLRESDQRTYRIRDGGVSSSTVVGGYIYYWVLTARQGRSIDE